MIKTMGMARVILSAQAMEELERLGPVMHARVRNILQRLTAWPAVSGAKPLRKQLAGRYRIRTGDYRIQFMVRQDVVMIERIGHRDGFYED